MKTTTTTTTKETKRLNFINHNDTVIKKGFGLEIYFNKFSTIECNTIDDIEKIVNSESVSIYEDVSYSYSYSFGVIIFERSNHEEIVRYIGSTGSGHPTIEIELLKED